MTNAEIEAFLAICEEKKFTSAADKLFISQSSLSSRLKTLETELDCTLFIRHRGAKEVSLTSYGETLYPLAVHYRELMEQMRFIACEAPRRLRVSTFSSLGAYLFPPIYDAFLTRYPDTDLEIYSNDYTEHSCSQLDDHSLDLAFTTGQATSRKVKVIPIFSEKMMFVCAADAYYPETVKLSHLDTKNEVYISWCPDFNDWRESTFLSGATPGVRLSIMEQLRFFLEKENRWAIVPASVAIGLTMRSKKIQIRNTDFLIPPRITNCLLLPQTMDNPCAVDFLRTMKEYLVVQYEKKSILF